MQLLVRRTVVGCIGVLVASLFLGGTAQAVDNPFTAARACANDFKGSWAPVTDGHRPIKNDDGKVIGDVYLMYDGGSGKNCVVTIKHVNVGVETPVSASLDVKGVGFEGDSDYYKYYAAIEQGARDRCVAYRGAVYHGGRLHSGGRDEWGNCG